MIHVGHIYANIAGDSRYTDLLEVQFDPDTCKVHLVVSSTVSADGIDGGGGASKYTLQETVTVDREPKAVLKALKALLSKGCYNFKRYGKPSKRMTWHTEDGRKYGVNLAVVASALCNLENE